MTFGDNVRLLSTPETEALGVAGKVGQVYGVTTPSVTGIAVIGNLVGDCAFNVHFEGRTDTDSIWFVPELLEFVDHGPGTEIRLNGVPKKWTRSESGEWIEAPLKKPWWKFW
jgi:hypothetical protein